MFKIKQGRKGGTNKNDKKSQKANWRPKCNHI